jgi:hypothetical protein
MAGTFSWTCPFCNRPTTVSDHDTQTFDSTLYLDNADGRKVVFGRYIVCPNDECKRLSLSISLYEARKIQGNTKPTELIKNISILPPSKAKAFPDYIPQPIIVDYQEACLILNGSAKASATLSRRCLQGMIRDFWGAKRPADHKGPWRLKEEIESIEDQVEPETWEAIDGVRKIGNIGAHMEEDINVIVDVDPEEADKLIWLIEVLIKDWYINKHERQAKLAEIKEAAGAKAKPKGSS